MCVCATMTNKVFMWVSKHAGGHLLCVSECMQALRMGIKCMNECECVRVCVCRKWAICCMTPGHQSLSHLSPNKEPVVCTSIHLCTVSDSKVVEYGFTPTWLHCLDTALAPFIRSQQ